MGLTDSYVIPKQPLRWICPGLRLYLGSWNSDSLSRDPATATASRGSQGTRAGQREDHKSDSQHARDCNTPSLWGFCNPPFPPFQKNSEEYKQHLHIPFSTFPHLQLKGSKVNLALRLTAPSFPRPLENCQQSVRASWDGFGNGSVEELCRQVLCEGGPHRSWKSGSPGRVSLGHSHACTLHDNRFLRPTLPTPCLTKVPSPRKEREGL